MGGNPWVVTGGAGYLGSYVVERLLERGLPVTVVDDLSSGRPQHLRAFEGVSGFTHERLDIRTTGAVTDLFRAIQPGVVIHLAALHFIPAAVADPPLAVSLNVHGTQSLLSAARTANVETFWLASTGDVYEPSEAPHREESPCAPFNIYGLTKLMAEHLVALESRLRPQARFFVGRLFNLYGPRETNPHILPEILEQLRRDRRAPLRLGNLWPLRDLVPVADAARAVIESAERCPPGLSVMNVATGTAQSMQDVLDVIDHLLRGQLRVVTDPAKVRPVERGHLQADVTRLRGLLGWAPHADLERGIRELLFAEGLL